jgi:hypothetical protein
MGKSISTNFSLRLAGVNKPAIVGDASVASMLTGKNFYSVTYTVDKTGTFLGEITDFLAVKTKSPVLIEFQRVDMSVPNQIYCNSLFINHGDFGKVWLRLPENVPDVIVTVWYSTDSPLLAQDRYINAIQLNKKKHKLRLKNLNGKTLGVPVEKDKTFLSLDHNSLDNITAITHTGEQKELPVYKI